MIKTGKDHLEQLRDGRVVFIGDEKEIHKCAQDLKWDISKYEIIHEPIENNTAAIAAIFALKLQPRLYVMKAPFENPVA